MEYLIIILVVTMLYFVVSWKIDPDKWLDMDLDGNKYIKKMEIEKKAVKKRTRKSTTRDKTKKKKTTTKRKTKRKTKKK